ncbi:MAG TPA: rhodanese-like domain-containing protein [Candidatus Sulfotelmatobacter sp.]|nr:rhodanese-like domain-containing protein [Candidatus Sulfotelmatobacter sp.]
MKTEAKRYLMLALSAVFSSTILAAQAAEIPAERLIHTEELARILQSPKEEKPLLIHVGFHVLYLQAHIPGSEYYGPAADANTLQKLRARVESLPRSKFIVIYCGCCPWSHCPSVKPAYDALHAMGFTNLKVLYIPDNFGTDWRDKGYPTTQGE